MTFFFRLSLLFVALYVSSIKAEIIDEIDQGVNIPDSSIINRPMVTGFSLDTIQTAFDISKAHENTKVIEYQDNVTYKIRLRELVTTQFILPSGERIAAHVLGDDKTFDFTPFNENKYNLSNMFTVRPKYAGADTNLTIVGESGNVYSFYLRSDSYESKIVPDFVVRFHNINEDEKRALTLMNDLKIKNLDIKESDQDYLRSLPDFDVKNMNINYSISEGNDHLKPSVIFDDGYWTYFIYDDLDKPKNLPVFYKVIDGFDSPAMTRRVGNMIIAESTSSKGWTLRSGDLHVCIRLDIKNG